MAVILAFLVARLFVFSPEGLWMSENRRFERFSEEVFRCEMSGNSLNLHYTLADPGAYGIETEEVSLGNASVEARRASLAMMENYLETLDGFDYEKLSAKHQLTYDIFRKDLETGLEGAAYLLYDEPLGASLGIQAQLPILLAEYTFRTKGDIEDYLALLAQIPDYFSTILSFEREKAAAGLFMSKSCAQAIADQCEEFISDPEHNYLLELFDERIDAITNLTEDEKIAFKNRNQAILNSYVIPAYRELGQKLLSYAGSSQNEQGLYYLPDGTSYYEYLVKSTTGDDRNVEEIEEAIKVQMVADYTAIQNLLQNNTNTGAAASDAGAAASDAGTTAAQDSSALLSPVAMLDTLRQKITADFPVLPSVSCEVKYVHASLQDYLSPAFYLTPAIDDYENNVIYINPGSNYTGLELFTTLAHEGYPGHLYQSVSFSAGNPDLLRNILESGGYTEGWATYVELYACSLWEDDPEAASLYQKNRSFTLGLASLLDIGIHYHGYSAEDVTAFLQQLGFSEDTSASLYETILEAPANYLKYYVGYLNFCSLRDELQDVLGDQFSLKEFHRRVMETGPAPFSILRRQVLGGDA
jgi:uncharacterized protein (DUF885 family)